MKTTLDLPEDLIREIKLRAVMQRRTVKDLVAECLRQGLDATPPPLAVKPAANAKVQIDANGLPVIQCRANAPAARMSRKKLLQLEQAAQADEDAQRAGIAI
jgi:plasmid stability protein